MSSHHSKTLPSLSKARNYQDWLKLIKIWRNFSDLTETKQGPAIVLSLENEVLDAVKELSEKVILVIITKGFLKLANLHMLIKQKSPLLPINLALLTFGKLLIVFSTKVNLLYLLYSMGRRCCLLHLIKQNCLLTTFLRTLILMTHVSLYFFSLIELI